MRTPQTRSSRRPKAGKTPRTRQAQTLRQTATQAKRPLSSKKRFRYPAAHPHLSTQLLRHRRRAFKPFRPPRNKSFTATAAALYDSRHNSQHTQKNFPEKRGLPLPFAFGKLLAVQSDADAKESPPSSPHNSPTQKKSLSESRKALLLSMKCRLLLSTTRRFPRPYQCHSARRQKK